MITVSTRGSVASYLSILSGAVILSSTLLSAPAHAQQGPPPVNVTGEVSIADDRTPVQISDSDFCPVPGQCVVEVMTVPEGQRLVIEHIGLRTTFAPAAPGTNAAVRLNTQFGDKFQSIALGATTNTGPGINTADLYSSPVKLYSQSGSPVRCVVLAPNFETFRDMSCTLTGYLEPED
jgi:hypothetical protein